MKNIAVILFASVMSLVISNVSVAHSAKKSDFELTAQTRFPQSMNGMTVLQLTVRDAAAKAGVCPYYLKKLEFTTPPSTLNLEIFEETCLNDAFGPSTGIFNWAVPQSLLATGKSLKVNVNGQATATLNYDLNQNKFIVQSK